LGKAYTYLSMWTSIGALVISTALLVDIDFDRHKMVHGFVIVILYLSISIFLNVSDFMYFPAVLSLALEGLCSLMFLEGKEMILIGTNSNQRSLSLNPMILFSDISMSHWVVLLYDKTTKKLHYTHATGKQSNLEVVTKTLSLDIGPKKFFQQLHGMGFYNLRRSDEVIEASEIFVQTEKICREYAIRFACDISTSKTFTYILSLSLFRHSTLLLGLYYILFLLDRVNLSRNDVFKFPDLAFVLYMLYDYVEYARGSFRLGNARTSKKDIRCYAAETLIHVAVFSLYFLFHDFVFDGLLLLVVMTLSFVYYYLLKFLHDLITSALKPRSQKTR